jgi:hypothetical protein
VWVPVTSKYYTKMIAAWQAWMRNMPGATRYALAGHSTEAEAEFMIWESTCSEHPDVCPPAFAKEVQKLYWQGMLAELPLAMALSGDGVSRGGVGGDPGPLAAVAGDIAAADASDDGVIIGASLSCAESFAPSTEVLLASGKAVPISSLKPGDKVLATNTSTGKTSPETITAVEVNHDTDLYDLRVKTSHGVEVIHTTSSHLFWDPVAHAWVKAASLKPGESLKTADGGTATADSGTVPANHDGWMWDLTIPGDNDHDFYVLAGNLGQPGNGQHAFGGAARVVPLLAHNYSCDLPADEGVNGGHTIEKHVGKDLQFLIDRNKPNASSFIDLNAAQLETQANIDAHESGIRWWLENMSNDKITIQSPIVDPGDAVVWNRASSSFVPATSVITVLNRDPLVPNGFTVLTSYANP